MCRDTSHIQAQDAPKWPLYSLNKTMVHLHYPIGLYNIHDNPLLTSLMPWCSSPLQSNPTLASGFDLGKSECIPDPSSTERVLLPGLLPPAARPALPPSVLPLPPPPASVGPFDIDHPRARSLSGPSQMVKQIPTQCCSAEHVPRPVNSFIIFHIELWQRYQHTVQCSNHNFSRYSSDVWKSLSDEAKDTYRIRAKEAREEHARAHPNHQYSPVWHSKLRPKAVDNPSSTGVQGPQLVELATQEIEVATGSGGSCDNASTTGGSPSIPSTPSSPTSSNLPFSPSLPPCFLPSLVAPSLPVASSGRPTSDMLSTDHLLASGFDVSMQASSGLDAHPQGEAPPRDTQLLLQPYEVDWDSFMAELAQSSPHQPYAPDTPFSTDEPVEGPSGVLSPFGHMDTEVNGL
ncbi:hypothetical protein OF83DRAFT_1178111 [Amylostereum chailletii]|nr:hypothetical protein OF83DRAFT_1178111 [Amylostereum chailletii]